MSTPEGKVKIYVKKRLAEAFGSDMWLYSPPGGMFGRAGTPDLIGLWRGVFFAIELKADETCNPSPLQVKSLNHIKAAGGVAAIVRGKDVQKVDSIISAIRSRAEGFTWR